jgi:hypothetical protein
MLWMASSPVAYDKLNQELLTRVPHVVPEYLAIKKRWDGKEPGPHIVYGDALTPFLIDLLEATGREAELQSIFELLEELANQEDPKVQEVVATSVLERLNDKAEWRTRARQFMGPTTLQFSRDIEEAWGS